MLLFGAALQRHNRACFTPWRRPARRTIDEPANKSREESSLAVGAWASLNYERCWFDVSQSRSLAVSPPLSCLQRRSWVYFLPPLIALRRFTLERSTAPLSCLSLLPASLLSSLSISIPIPIPIRIPIPFDPNKPYLQRPPQVHIPLPHPFHIPSWETPHARSRTSVPSASNHLFEKPARKIDSIPSKSASSSSRVLHQDPEIPCRVPPSHNSHNSHTRRAPARPIALPRHALLHMHRASHTSPAQSRPSEQKEGDAAH